MSNLVYNWQLQVRYGEVGHNGLATLSSVANWLQEAAGLSANSLGFGESVMTAQGVTWILSRMVLRLNRLPGAGEQIAVRTWPSKYEHFGYRGYELTDDVGKTLLVGGSAWAVMDMATHKMTALPDKLTVVYPENAPECEPFTGRVLPRLNENGMGTAIRVRQDDLDINGHVNNCRYLSWLLECLPAQAACPKLVDVAFRAECFPGDELQSVAAAAENEPMRLIHAIRRDGHDACRAVTQWEAPVF